MSLKERDEFVEDILPRCSHAAWRRPQPNSACVAKFHNGMGYCSAASRAKTFPRSDKSESRRRKDFLTLGRNMCTTRMFVKLMLTMANVTTNHTKSLVRQALNKVAPRSQAPPLVLTRYQKCCNARWAHPSKREIIR